MSGPVQSKSWSTCTLADGAADVKMQSDLAHLENEEENLRRELEDWPYRIKFWQRLSAPITTTTTTTTESKNQELEAELGVRPAAPEIHLQLCNIGLRIHQ